MSEIATLTSKSQLTVPKSVRESMGVGPGDKIRFVPARSGYRLVVVKRDLNSLYGMFKGRRKTPLSIQAMKACIAEMGSKEEPAD